MTEEAADTTPFGTLLHFRKDIVAAQPRVSAGRSSVGSLRHAVARDCAHDAAGARCLHHRLAQRA